jgi:hypothetical protein
MIKTLYEELGRSPDGLLGDKVLSSKPFLECIKIQKADGTLQSVEPGGTVSKESTYVVDLAMLKSFYDMNRDRRS